MGYVLLPTKLGPKTALILSSEVADKYQSGIMHKIFSIES